MLKTWLHESGQRQHETTLSARSVPRSNDSGGQEVRLVQHVVIGCIHVLWTACIASGIIVLGLSLAVIFGWLR